MSQSSLHLLKIDYCAISFFQAVLEVNSHFHVLHVRFLLAFTWRIIWIVYSEIGADSLSFRNLHMRVVSDCASDECCIRKSYRFGKILKNNPILLWWFVMSRMICCEVLYFDDGWCFRDVRFTENFIYRQLRKKSIYRILE